MATKTKKTTSKKSNAKSKPAAKPEKPASAGDTEKALAFDRVAALEDERRKVEAEVESARRSLKEAKEDLAGITNDLKRAIWETAHPEAYPLYTATPSANGHAKKSPADAPAIIVPSDDESWKAIPLREALVGLKPSGIFDKLEGRQIFTMGELAEYSAAKNGTQRITDIAGIGPGAAAKIEEACTAFWARRATAKPDSKSEGEPEETKTETPDHAFKATPIDRLTIHKSQKKAILDAGYKTVGELEEAIEKKGPAPMLAFLQAAPIGLDPMSADDVVKCVSKLADEVLNKEPK